MESLIKKIQYDNYGVYGSKRTFEILKLKGYGVSYKTNFNINKASEKWYN